MKWAKPLLLAAAVLATAPNVVQAGAICGPGNHWVDTCAGGTYDFYSTSTVALLLDLDGNGSLETNVPFLQLSGVTSVFLGAGVPHTMGTELYYMFETGTGGVTLRAGDGVANLQNDGPLYSPGRIDEQPSPPLADSFFDVFFQLEIPALSGPILFLHNWQGLQVRCQGLTQAPPGVCSYQNLNFPLALYDNDEVLRGLLGETPQGFAHHVVTPTPEPAAWLTAGAGALLLWLRRRTETNQ